MDLETLKILGITPEKIMEMAVEKLISGMREHYDDEYIEQRAARTFKEELQRKIDDAVSAFLDKQLEPVLKGAVSTLILQPTNHYGERKGEPIPFVEYVTKRASEWLGEPVDGEGRAGRDSYGGGTKQPRLMWAFDKYFGYQMQAAIKSVLDASLQSLGGSLAKMVEEHTRKLTAVVKVSLQESR